MPTNTDQGLNSKYNKRLSWIRDPHSKIDLQITSKTTTFAEVCYNLASDFPGDVSNDIPSVVK